MGKYTKVYIWSVIVALGGFLFGFDTAVISGVELHIQELFQLTSFEHGFTIASALLGTIIGALVAGKPADKYGRRPALFVIAALYVVSAFGSALATSAWMFITFRLLGGVAIGVSSVIAPMYISEIAPAEIRGRMTAMFQFNVIFGILIAYVSNYLLREIGDEPWRWMLGVAAIPSVMFFFLLFYIPESPRFLVKIGKIDLAKKVLEKTNISFVDKEIKNIELSMQSPSKQKENLFSRKYSKPIMIAFLVAMFNQFSGINAILYFVPRIFELSGLSSSDSLQQSIMIGVINAVSTLIGLALIDKVGRKRLLITGSIGMAVFLGLVSKAFHLGQFEGISLLVYLLLYILFFGFSSGAVIWVLISEVFPNSVRGKGQSFGSFTHWFFAALVTFLFPIITRNYDIAGAGWVFSFFALMMIVQAIVVWKFFPETKGRTLEDLSTNL